MKLVKIALAGLILCGFDAAAPDAFPSPPPSGRVQQQRIATLSQAVEVLISSDLSHVAVIDQRGQRQCLAVDGKAGPESDALWFVEHDGPLFGPGGIPVLYARADQGRRRLVVNGVPGPECDAWLDQTSCGPNRTSIVYTAVEISRKAFVAIDGQPGPIYADVSCPAFSADRTRIAYVACTGRGPQRKFIPIIDGRAGPEYDEIAIPSSGIWSVFSTDNKRTAYAARLGPKWRIVTDGQSGREYDQIAPDSLAFSSDGRRIACAARTGPQWCVVLDGQPGKQYDGIGPGPIRFLSNAENIAFTALAGSKWLTVIGDQPPVTCDEIADLTVSPSGRHVAYVGRKGKKWQAVVDGHGGPEYDQIGLPEHERFWASADGERLAYAGRLGSKWHVVVDGQPGAACDEIQQEAAPFFFSPDGKRTAYIARTGKKWSVVIDGQSGPACDSVERGSFEFSDDGVRTACAALRDDNWQVVVDNRPGPKYDEVDASSRIFTLRGTRVAYAANRDKKWRVMVNGEEGPQYDDVSELIYSPDGQRMAYVAGRIVDRCTRDQSLVLDGQAGPWYRRIGELCMFCGSEGHVSSTGFGRHRSDTANGKFVLGHDNVYGIVFSPDGKHIAYPAGTRDEVRMIHDGKPGPAYHEAGAPVFSSDGKRLAYTAIVDKSDEGKQLVVADGQPGPVYDQVELPRGRGASCFSADGKHTVYAAQKDGEWHAVVDGREGPACDAFFGPESTTSYGQPAAYASWRSVTYNAPVRQEIRKQSAADPFSRSVTRHGERLWQYGPDYDQSSFRPVFFGAGGEHVAYVGVAQTQARAMVVVDGVPGPQYDQVGKPVVSDDGRRVGYIAGRGQGEHRKVMAVIDGHEGPEYDDVPLNRGDEWEPFSHAGQHSAYMARTGRKWRAIVDGRPGPEYDEVYPIAPASWYSFFSADGSRIVYLARRGEKWRAVIDGREGPEFDRFEGHLPLAFSPDGKRVAYIAQWGQGPRWRYRVIVDGQQGPEYEAKWVAGPIFSPDGRRTAYVGQRGGKKFVVLDGKELAPHDGVDGIRLHFSPDSGRLAYIAYRGEEDAQKAHFVVDGREGPEHGDHIWDTYFSPDSKHAAYIAINGRWQDQARTEQLVVDGKEDPAVDEVEASSIRWSSDGRHLAYVAKDHSADPFAGGREWVVLDGQAQSKYTWVHDLAFNAEGKHLAYKACRDSGTACVVQDGQPGPAFDEIEWLPLWAHGSPFTPDGRHLCYQARRGGKHVVVLDNQAGPEFDRVLCTWLPLGTWRGSPDKRRSMWPPRILPDGAIQYPALTADNPAELYIVTQWPATEAAPR